MPTPPPSPLLSLSPLPVSPPRDIIVRNRELRAKERRALEVRELEDDSRIRREATIWWAGGRRTGSRQTRQEARAEGVRSCDMRVAEGGRAVRILTRVVRSNPHHDSGHFSVRSTSGLEPDGVRSREMVSGESTRRTEHQAWRAAVAPEAGRNP